MKKIPVHTTKGIVYITTMEDFISRLSVKELDFICNFTNKWCDVPPFITRANAGEVGKEYFKQRLAAKIKHHNTKKPIFNDEGILTAKSILDKLNLK